MSAFEAEGSRFESWRAQKLWRVKIEYLASNQEMGVRFPPRANAKHLTKSGTLSNYASLAQLVEQLPLKEMVGGSNPSRGTLYSYLWKKLFWLTKMIKRREWKKK